MKPPTQRDPEAPLVWLIVVLILAVMVAVGWVGR